MKISTITFHNTSNFGATLQCLALYKYLTDHNCDVEVINYLPSYVRAKKSASKEIRKVSHSNNKMKAVIKGLAYLAHTSKLSRREHHFENFINCHLKLSRLYVEYSDLRENPPKSDFYICGSDQIWNPALTGGELDKAFFLCFTNGKKASYGASMGEYIIETNAEELKKLTADYDYISVREESTAIRLSDAIKKPVETVLDCTLLIDKEDYFQYEESVSKLDKPYLLFYNMQKTTLSVDLARKISQDKGLEIIDISPNPLLKIKGSKKMIDIGPGEFLTLFKNANYVVTNSFHGTVFSILYKKQFVCTLHSTRGGRVYDLLTSLGLEDRIISDVCERNLNDINYETVYSALQELRINSCNYLQKCLNNL